MRTMHCPAVKRIRRPLLLLVTVSVLAAGLALPVSAQSGRTPMWIDRVEFSHTLGRDLAGPYTLGVDIHVTSEDGPVARAQLFIIVIGPANEEISARARTDADGLASFIVLVPGAGPYTVEVKRLHGGGPFYWDPNLDIEDPHLYLIPLTVGTVFVGDNTYSGLSRRIRQFTSQGTFIREWSPKTTTESTDDSYQVWDLTTDSQGYVYANLQGLTLCEVQKYTSYGTLVHAIGYEDCTVGDDPLDDLLGNLIAVDSQDRLYVIDGDPSLGVQNEIQIFDSNGTYVDTWLVPFSANVVDLEFDQNDNLYLVEFSDSIHKFSPSGTHLLSWSATQSPTPQFFQIAVHPGNLVYVTDLDDNVWVYTSGGQPIANWHGGAGGESAVAIGIDAFGQVYLTSRGTSLSAPPYVAKYESDGRFLLAWDALAGTANVLNTEILCIAVHH